MLRLFDHLVIGVAELRRVVVECPGEFEQPLLEDAFEFESKFHLRRDQVQTQAGADRLG